MSAPTLSYAALRLPHRSPPRQPRQLASAMFVLGIAVGHGLNQPRIRILRRQLARQKHAARRDPLTGLPNRTVVYELLDRSHPALVGLCDLDQLKTVNDRHGHPAGDRLLQHVAGRLATAMSGAGLAARLGGDEFALLWRYPQADPIAAGRTVLNQLSQPVTVAGHPLRPQASLGLAAAGPVLSGRRLLAAADTAMYQAKNSPGRVELLQHPDPPTTTNRPTRRRRDHHPSQ